VPDSSSHFDLDDLMSEQIACDAVGAGRGSRNYPAIAHVVVTPGPP